MTDKTCSGFTKDDELDATVAILADLPVDLANTFSAVVKAHLQCNSPAQRLALLKCIGLVRNAAHDALMLYLDAPPQLVPMDDPVDLDAMVRGVSGKAGPEIGR